MPTLPELLLQYGIRPRNYREGDQKLLCPKCSHQRKNRKDPCLSLTIERESAVWKCHNCDWSGAVRERDDNRPGPQQRRRPPPARPTKTPDQAGPTALSWLATRGIS